MDDIPGLPRSMTAAQFLDWTPPAGFERYRWHLLDGEPMHMPPFVGEQAVLAGEAHYTISAHLRWLDNGARVAPMVLILGGGSHRWLYVAALAATRIPDCGEVVMPDPVLAIEIKTPENWKLARLGVYALKRSHTIEEILVLDSARVSAVLHRRDANGQWPDDPEHLDLCDRVHLRSIGVEVLLDRFYHCVDPGERAAMPRRKEVPHPGTVIVRECLKAHGLTVEQAAAHLGVARSYLGDVVAGVDRVTADLAVRLSKAFVGTPRAWLRLQHGYDLAQVRAEEIEVECLSAPAAQQGLPQPHHDDYDEDGVLRDEVRAPINPPAASLLVTDGTADEELSAFIRGKRRGQHS